jgi:hypothetical protein
VYVFTEKKPIDRTRVFRIRRADQEDWQSIEVWWDSDFKRARCTDCQSILRGMSASCKHAKALKRHMAHTR